MKETFGIDPRLTSEAPPRTDDRVASPR